MEKESLDSLTSTGELYRPPFYHPSLHFYGNKINIREYDPKLLKRKQMREENTRLLNSQAPSYASSSIPIPPLYDSTSKAEDFNTASLIDLNDPDDLENEELFREASVVSIPNSMGSKESIRVEVKKVNRKKTSPSGSPKQDTIARKRLDSVSSKSITSLTAYNQSLTLPPIAGVKIESQGPGRDNTFRER